MLKYCASVMNSKDLKSMISKHQNHILGSLGFQIHSNTRNMLKYQSSCSVKAASRLGVFVITAVLHAVLYLLLFCCLIHHVLIM